MNKNDENMFIEFIPNTSKLEFTHKFCKPQVSPIWNGSRIYGKVGRKVCVIMLLAENQSRDVDGVWWKPKHTGAASNHKGPLFLYVHVTWQYGRVGDDKPFWAWFCGNI